MIGDIFRVLRAGVELSNAEVWKKRQVLVNALAALLAALAGLASAFGHPLAIDQDGIGALAAGIAAAVGVFNGWATVATTQRIGLPSGRDDSGTTPPDDDAGKPAGVNWDASVG